MNEGTIQDIASREVRWQVEGVSWRLRRSSPEEEPVRLWREGAELLFPRTELVPLLESLRTLVRRKPVGAGRSWTLEADAALELAFDAGESIPALADRFERTRGAITARLVKLGRIEDRGQRRWPVA